MVLHGTPASKGIAVGKVFIYKPFAANVAQTFCAEGDTACQIDKYRQVKAAAEAELDAVVASLEKTDPEKAKIFVAHQDIVNDVAMDEEIIGGIEGQLWAGDWAIQSVYAQFIDMMKAIPDPLIQERAADLQDVRSRLLRIWNGVGEENLSTLSEPVIVAAHDLFPSDTATLARDKVLAILTEVGGTTSHSAIIARSYGIPAVLGVPGLLDALKPDQIVGVDAIHGDITLSPTPQQIAQFDTEREAYAKQAAVTKQFLDTQPLMADGTRIDIGLNIGAANAEELEGAKYTDYVGLFRTEFLYMGKPQLPSEDEQYEIYKTVLSTFAPRPVTLRTLDIGGDKTLDSMELPVEENPFLGLRALRLCFDLPEVFTTQLRAALRASVHGELHLMLPMVGSMDDIRRAKEIIAGVRRKLEEENIPVADNVKIGIMIEIPSIAMIADLAAQEVDFASLGTNDLCQYLTAVDRMNPSVAQYYQTYHPGLFRLIANVVTAFNEAGKPVSVCGEMGGDPLAAAVLVGFGMKKLSMGLASVASIKQMLASLTSEKAQQAASLALNLATAAEVETELSKLLSK